MEESTSETHRVKGSNHSEHVRRQCSSAENTAADVWDLFIPSVCPGLSFEIGMPTAIIVKAVIWDSPCESVPLGTSGQRRPTSACASAQSD